MRRLPTMTILIWLMCTPTGCHDEETTCVSELACAAQPEGLIETCCTTHNDDSFSCWYEAPDGVVFDCEPIVDEASAGSYCEQAVEDLVAHCSE